MSSNNDSDAPLANMLLNKCTKSECLSQLPQSRRPEGAPPLQRQAPSLVVILPSSKTVRCKARSEEDDLADLAIAFKKQCQSAAATGVAPSALQPSDAQAGTGEDTPNVKGNASSTIAYYWPDSDDSESQGSDDYEGVSSDRNKDETCNEDTLSTGDVDIPAMRLANVQHNWAQLNVAPVQPSTVAPNQGLTPGTANQAALEVLTGNLMHSSHGPHGGLAHGGVGGLAMGTRHVESSKRKRMATYSIFRDIINVYISMQGMDRLECPLIEYNVSVSRASIGEALTRIVAQGGRTARVLRDMDHSLFTVSTSMHPLALSNGGGDDLSFWEILTLEDVLSQESSNFNTPLHHCRACPETLMVAEQTQLPREDIYVIYIHSVVCAPATAPVTDDMPEWAAWDRLFLESIKPMASLFNKSYNEAFKIYAAVTVVMGIARETITADKKHMGMGKDG
ncbi:hypothetical protein ARMGADRAFT_1081984 [Armillaria gallica]|uniref:Uncharacterized protein n=1 Tax=Armillaria gallica TaxID=47427 RepID=A0A2H3D7I7_ARMGA|nr:hypothetical protein ARMGADRAFT_1081984 [Armillaria gallica]